MYKKKVRYIEFDQFYLPFGGHLDGENRWVKLSKLIPWDRVEEKYAKLFEDGKGVKAKSCRVALGSLIIKEKLNIADEEVVLQIQENPYLQFFIGMEGFRKKRPFNASLMVYFRKRLGPEIIAEINEWIHEEHVKKDHHDDDDGNNENKGKLLVDATCAPQDIKYPTDVGLLNEVREKTERIIDHLYEEVKGTLPKPRTYRKRARNAFLNFTKRKRPDEAVIRRAKRQQLQYIRRNFRAISKLARRVSLEKLSEKERTWLDVSKKIYEQQRYMYEERTWSISDRIVSVGQPYVRPIVRGKARAPVEFGAKLSISLIDGYAFVDRLSWDAYNEAEDLQGQIEKYKERFGYYPESVHADMIYRNRKNLEYCKKRHIRITGPKLGRPYKETALNKEKLRELKRQERDDEHARIPVEGFFGRAKRKYNLALIGEKLKETSETAIMVGVLVANLDKVLRDFFMWLLMMVNEVGKRIFSRSVLGENC